MPATQAHNSITTINIVTGCDKQSQDCQMYIAFFLVVKQADSSNNLHHLCISICSTQYEGKHFAQLISYIYARNLQNTSRVTYLTHLACIRGMTHDRRAICPRKVGEKCESN
uniref:Uncharacterized protein n=1 Tax=Arundo donax TaxID=35708 RepID=A0A0A9F030_ARUDO